MGYVAKLHAASRAIKPDEFREAAGRREHRQQKHAVAASEPGCRIGAERRGPGSGRLRKRNGTLSAPFVVPLVPRRWDASVVVAPPEHLRPCRLYSGEQVGAPAGGQAREPGQDGGLWSHHLRHGRRMLCPIRLGRTDAQCSPDRSDDWRIEGQCRSSARRAVALKTIFPRVGSGKDNALWQSLGHIRCMARRRDCERLACVCRILSGSARGIGVLWAIVRRPPLLSP